MRVNVGTVGLVQSFGPYPNGLKREGLMSDIGC